ncbi:hypothetical protein Tco_1384693 [Tanacetum coccineum]
MTHRSLLFINGSDEGSLKLQELMNLINILSDRVGVLEADLTKTKQTYSSAYTKLILRVRRLEAQRQVGGKETFLEITPMKLSNEQEGSGKASDEISTVARRKDTASEEIPSTESTKKIDWNDCLQSFRYHLQMQPGISYNEVRPLFEKALSGALDQKFGLWMQRKQDRSSKEPTAKRKKSIPRINIQGKSQKLELLKDELKDFWILDDCCADRDLQIYTPCLSLDENDEIWKDQHEYNLLSWRLHDFCGIHILLMNNGLAIHMLTEKKYPLSQEMLSKMLSTRLEVDHESSQAFELLRFIKAQVQK